MTAELERARVHARLVLGLVDWVARIDDDGQVTPVGHLRPRLAVRCPWCPLTHVHGVGVARRMYVREAPCRRGVYRIEITEAGEARLARLIAVTGWPPVTPWHDYD